MTDRPGTRVNDALPGGGPNPSPSYGSEWDVDETEPALIAKCMDGNLEAFDRLMEIHQSRIYNLTYRMMGSKEDASDMTQETFLRAFNSLNRFRGSSSFSTWVYRIACNLCLDEIKRQKRQKARVVDATVQIADDEEIDLIEQMGDSSLDPQEVLIRREKQEMIQQAIATLPEHQRATLVLYDIQGEPYEEIAVALDISIGTVKSRLNRARLSLKSRLEALREQI